MTAQPATAQPLPATTALGATLGRLRKRLLRTTLLMLLLCTAIALMLNGFFMRGLGTKAVYSFAIGGCCWLISEAGTLLQAAGSDLLRRARGLPASTGGYERGWRGKIASTVACIVAGPLLGTHIGDAITGYRSAPLWELGAANSRLTVLLALLGSAVVISVISSMERLASARAQAEAAQRLASDTQLRLLQSQLEPHMLFNTLANLRVLIGLDAARAQDMLDHLIAFLRATLQASRTGSHALSSEFERTADYLALMAVRMGPRLQVRLDLPEALRTLQVPPLLLQPLVENSIQHGLEPQLEGGRIDVTARRDGDALLLTVRDTGVGRGRAPGHAAPLPQAAAAAPGSSALRAERPAGGFGLAGTRERLQTLYGARGSLELADALDADGGTLATLRLPLNIASAATAPTLSAGLPAHPPATAPCPPSAP
jgi:hypothetical protein